MGPLVNIIVGANLIPDALHTGLLEFVNIFGILVILFASFAIITIIDSELIIKTIVLLRFSGNIFFWMLLFFTVLGNILLPLSAYRF
ncbi:hypothetical protein CF160_14850 [Enterococcus pseudoavium]|nr:hypothetical protein CF160_14850 [Enterococcus pseudoavium]